MRYGLIGEKLGHSYSKYIHERMVDCEYDLIPLNEDEFDLFMKAKKFAGINVTIPYKERVIPYLNDVDDLAKKIGAVNTIVNTNGSLKGYNTDFYGLLYLFNSNKIKVEHKKCLVLGSGGTAKTAQAVLEKLKAKEIITVSRKPRGSKETSYEECYERHNDAQVIVNTTPVGMYPNMDASPLDLATFIQCIAVIDVIFNPIETRLTKQAKDLGILAVTGLPMLVAQAKQAEEYFRAIKLDDAIIDTITQELMEKI
ncbi:MAG: shikimate dehydrogenase [Clostridiales bacterium]|jgi:shikimate dehydrogenase|nr:shikimate dehydrogenase [Clostridiales bacterium]